MPSRSGSALGTGLAVAGIAVLAAASCGLLPKDEGNGGGSGGSMAMPGTGGNAMGLKLGWGGPYPFPQNKRSGSCALTTAGNASQTVQAQYNGWRTNLVTSSGAGAGLRVRRPTNQDDTVSEGIAYGMISAVYVNDRPTFDGLWTYAQAHFDAKGLMNWKITAGGGVASDGMGSASDGDADMIWALIMASNQWSDRNYLAAAQRMIDAMYQSSIGTDGLLRPGDNWGNTPLTNPSYFSPAYFRVFAVVSNNTWWSTTILDRNYAILTAVSGTNGLVPDWTNNQSVVNQGFLMPGLDNSSYGYDATRTPWRIAMDYCFHGEPRAKAYLDKVGAFFNGVGAANIGDGYTLSGGQKTANHNMAFIGPAGVSGMAGFQSLLDGAFAFGANNAGDNSYYGSSLRVITMLMMSGNFLDYSKP